MVALVDSRVPLVASQVSDRWQPYDFALVVMEWEASEESSMSAATIRRGIEGKRFRSVAYLRRLPNSKSWGTMSGSMGRMSVSFDRRLFRSRTRR